ncbi:MAG: FliA/WhiG family RNA polymerase sigma factor [Nitrospinae bacterium]|nr:FliA/WhiG family RNA polymerase sigma factor [Nitrospinota bacterium]
MQGLVLEYAPIIKYIAHRIAFRLPPYIEIDDLISAGIMGLIDALEKYDPSRGAKFRTYAEFRIKGAIMDEIRSLDWIPRSVRQKASELEDTYLKLGQKLGRPAYDEEVAEALHINMDEYFDLLKKANPIHIFSFEEIEDRGNDDEKMNLLNCLTGSKDSDPQSALKVNETKNIIANVIDGLPVQERIMVSLYYYEGLTMKEIGEVLGITESRISQIHTKAVLMLRGKLKRFMEDEIF